MPAQHQHRRAVEPGVGQSDHQREGRGQPQRVPQRARRAPGPRRPSPPGTAPAAAAPPAGSGRRTARVTTKQQRDQQLGARVARATARCRVRPACRARADPAARRPAGSRGVLHAAHASSGVGSQCRALRRRRPRPTSITSASVTTPPTRPASVVPAFTSGQAGACARRPAAAVGQGVTRQPGQMLLQPVQRARAGPTPGAPVSPQAGGPEPPTIPGRRAGSMQTTTARRR